MPRHGPRLPRVRRRCSPSFLPACRDGTASPRRPVSRISVPGRRAWPIRCAYPTPTTRGHRCSAVVLRHGVGRSVCNALPAQRGLRVICPLFQKWQVPAVQQDCRSRRHRGVLVTNALYPAVCMQGRSAKNKHVNLVVYNDDVKVHIVNDVETARLAKLQAHALLQQAPVGTDR